MKFIPRVLTDGRAVALSGHINRVKDKTIRKNLQIRSAAIPPAGSSLVKRKDFKFTDRPRGKPVISFKNSSSDSWEEREYPASTGNGPIRVVHAKASIDGLSVERRLTVKRASSHLKTVYRAGEPQPTITPVEARLEGLVIDGVRFTVTLDMEPVIKCGTCNEFHHACLHDPTFKNKHHHRTKSLYEPSESGPSGKGCFVCSLVERLDWEGELPPGAEVEHDSHVIVWPDFGKVILGEMLIADFSRRLTMVRLEMGSPLEGDVAAADVQSGGVGLP